VKTEGVVLKKYKKVRSGLKIKERRYGKTR
jgi:hypothetical protein